MKFVFDSSRRRSVRLVTFAAMLTVGLCSGAAHAEKTDRAQPMNIESDTLRHDDLAQLSVFTGNVVLTKGSIVIRGERLEVRQDPDGYQYGVVTALPGTRAYFRQKRDTAPGTPDEFIEGEGDTIDYDGRADRVKFIHRAEMRRLVGGKVADSVRGDVIVYNNITDVYTVDGNAGKAGPGNPGGRVRAILAPRGGPGAAAVTPAAPGGSPSSNLRSSPQLQGQTR
jgi:lipopolysaccharide export system protein LptA